MKSTTKTIIIAGVSIVLLVAAIGFYMYNKPHADVTKATPAYTLPAMELNREFISNDSLAEAKYLGMVVQISGKIADVKSDDVHGVIITLDDAMMGVRCAMDTNYLPASQASSLVQGGDIRIKGICAGFDDMFGVVMNRCVILKP